MFPHPVHSPWGTLDPEGGTGRSQPHPQGEMLKWTGGDKQGRARWQVEGLIDSQAKDSKRLEKGVVGNSAKVVGHQLKQDRFWSETRKNCLTVMAAETKPALGTRGAPVPAGEGEV